jgi:exopolysaccharide biosynthesis protein
MDGSSAIAGVEDPEGFATTCDEFDQDLTAGREPRLAIGLRGDEWLAVAVDGRAPDRAGMTLSELADLLADLGADRALNLDGGSASAVIVGGRRCNAPRTDDGEPMERSSPTVTAFVAPARSAGS